MSPFSLSAVAVTCLPAAFMLVVYWKVQPWPAMSPRTLGCSLESGQLSQLSLSHPPLFSALSAGAGWRLRHRWAVCFSLPKACLQEINSLVPLRARRIWRKLNSRRMSLVSAGRDRRQNSMASSRHFHEDSSKSNLSKSKFINLETVEVTNIQRIAQRNKVPYSVFCE